MKKTLFVCILILAIPLSIVSQVDLQQPFKDCNIEGSITIYDYKNKRTLIGFGSQVMRKLGLEKRLFR